jgi:hypothetical protein
MVQSYLDETKTELPNFWIPRAAKRSGEKVTAALLRILR